MVNLLRNELMLIEICSEHSMIEKQGRQAEFRIGDEVWYAISRCDTRNGEKLSTKVGDLKRKEYHSTQLQKVMSAPHIK